MIRRMEKETQSVSAFTAVSTDKRENFTMPAEWSSQDAIWMAWPVYEPRKNHSEEIVVSEMIKALQDQVSIKLLVQDKKEIIKVKKALAKYGATERGVEFVVLPHGDLWLRDTGAVFVKNTEGKLRAVDFGFNMWGYESAQSEASKLEEQIDRKIATHTGIETIKSSMILEGGAFDVDGAGTLLATESVIFQRNPHMTKPQVEQELKRVLGIRKMVWLKQGVVEDDQTFRGVLPGNMFTTITTGGHIDEFARFVGGNKILLAEVAPEELLKDPLAKINNDRLQENVKILKASTNADGKNFDLIRIPIPDPITAWLSEGDGTYDYLKNLKYLDGTVFSKLVYSQFPKMKPGSKIKAILATSYLNYIVSNNVVLLPAYWKEGRPDTTRKKDQLAKDALAKIFPQHKIVQINPENLNVGGGGMHCITQQQPTSLTLASKK